MPAGFGKILVTGGAGFIGSHIVDRLLEEGVKIRVVDDLSTGNKTNLSQHENNPDFEFIQGDIRDFDVVKKAVNDVDAVVHEAALVSVTKSVEDPLLSNSINVVGTLNLLKASVESKVKRFVFASSCAVYGDTTVLPIKEDVLPKPLSPYAADKLAAENYIKVFDVTNNLETVCLRYFNVYGPRQKGGPYSGVISVFVNSFLNNEAPTVYGDGKQTRDFVNVKDVVEANLLALSKKQASGKVFNVCTGNATSVNKIIETLQQITDKTKIKPVYKKPRVGDIKHSYGDSSKGSSELGFQAKVKLERGLTELIDWSSKYI
jgi:nucleoside-diphosphate-sugar epimerase